MYSRCFIFKLYYASSISLSSSKVCIEVQEKKKKISALCFRPPQKGTSMSLSARSDGKEMYKKRVARVNLLSNNKGRCCSLTTRFANMVLRKMNIHEHWTRVTRFNPSRVFDYIINSSVSSFRLITRWYTKLFCYLCCCSFIKAFL